MRRRLVWFASLLLGGHRTAFAADAEAPAPVRLTFDSPANCPDRQAFLGQLKARSERIREAGSGEVAPSMRIELVVDDGEVTGKMTVRKLNGDEGYREIRGADCESVVSGLALVAAVVLDPTTVLAATASPTAPDTSPSPKPVSAPERNTPVTTTPSARSRSPTPPPRLSLGSALAAALGLGPDPQFLPRAFVDLEFAALPAHPSGRLSVGRGFTSSLNTPNGTAAITVTDVRFEPCADVWSPAVFRARVCGVAELGILTGEGRDTKDPQSATRASLELGLALRPTWVVHDQIVLGILLAGAAPLARYRFYFDTPDTTAYGLAAWSLIGEGSIGVRFW